MAAIILQNTESLPAMHFFYVKLPMSAGVLKRESEFHEGLEAALTQHNVGSVLGWGDSLSHINLAEPARVAFHRIDIDIGIDDVQTGVALLQRTLAALDAPMGTEIHYHADGAEWQDVSTPSGWRTEPRSTTPQ